MFFSALFACMQQPPISNFYLSIEDDVNIQLEIVSLELRPNDTNFSDKWKEVPLENEGAFFVTSQSLTKIGSLELTHNNDYIQTFPDVDNIFLESTSIVDIVEPIATPFTAKHNYIYDVAIKLSIIENQLFAVDAYVLESLQDNP